DLSRWHPDPQAREDVRRELGLAQDTPVIGSVARWNPLKDHPNLLAALARSLRRHPELRCLLIGDGMDSGNEALMRLLDQHQLHESVILMGRRSDVPRLMNALDVHVLSSSAEGFPNVVCEAMAAGVSNVVTDVGDAALIVATKAGSCRPAMRRPCPAPSTAPWTNWDRRLGRRVTNMPASGWPGCSRCKAWSTTTPRPGAPWRPGIRPSASAPAARGRRRIRRHRAARTRAS
ncbi:MAG: glycosyltransferase, partial [Alcaligenes sp.]